MSNVPGTLLIALYGSIASWPRVSLTRRRRRRPRPRWRVVVVSLSRRTVAACARRLRSLYNDVNDIFI